jgi:DNA polymerase III epsilon subunit-like protein
MPSNYNGLLTLSGNLMAAVDIETTGRQAGFHEIVQIAIQPLNAYLEPLEGVRPFYTMIQPEYFNRIEPESMQVHKIKLEDLRKSALDKWKVADLLDDWYQKLDLPVGKSLIPLAHNWAFEAGFLKDWLGLESFKQIFHPHPRDTMTLALSINDRAVLRGDRIPFSSFGLGALCNRFGIPLLSHHDALADTIATAALYKALLLMAF